jgi:hypothetical protein
MKKQAAKETRRDEIVPEKTSKDGKVVLDIIEAIHAAEKKQADADAYMYSEEKRKLKVCIYNLQFLFFLVCGLYLLKMQGSTLVYLCGLHYFHHFVTFVIVMDFKQFANNGED